MDKWSVTNAEMPREAQAFGDIYCFYQKFYRGDNSDEYWDAVVKDFCELTAKHPFPAAEGLLAAVLKELERKAKHGSESND